MSFLCFWRFLFITTLFATTVVTETTATTLYCITHEPGGIHNLEKCTTFDTKERPISAALLANDIDTNSSTITSTTTTNDNKITFELNCKADPSICEGVSSTFQRATDIISSIFQFETTLLINASFFNFCQEYQDCGYDEKMTSIGQAYPSISYVMVDQGDNMTRMYPQPLLKQFTQLDVKPAWTKYDINAQFNTEMNWYFVNNPNPINQDQTDFLKNVLHELIHGLGFVTSWTDDLYHGLAPLFQQELNRFITPILLASTNNDQLLDGYDTPQPFWGFVEFPFDKFINYKENNTNHLFTSFTKKLNLFSKSNVLFRNMIDLANSWYTSAQYQQAMAIYTKAIKALDVLAVIDSESVLWLETSINPYSTGSSLCHVDVTEYMNSTEYLMVYTANKGIGIIDQLNEMFPQGPIGPKLRKVMASLGYKIEGQKTIRTDLYYWSPPNGLVGTNSNPSPSLTIDTIGPARSPATSLTTNSTASTSTTKTTSTVSNSSSPASFSISSCIIILFTLLSLIY